jgi:hypothetical protein
MHLVRVFASEEEEEHMWDWEIHRGRYDDLLAEAERWRLARSIRCRSAIADAGVRRRALALIGRRLETVGRQLQSRAA